MIVRDAEKAERARWLAQRLVPERLLAKLLVANQPNHPFVELLSIKADVVDYDQFEREAVPEFEHQIQTDPEIVALRQPLEAMGFHFGFTGYLDPTGVERSFSIYRDHAAERQLSTQVDEHRTSKGQRASTTQNSERGRAQGDNMTKTYDALIIGGGHNGLVCAFYLAKAGMRVRVLERRHIVGGAAVTEEFHPGFRNSTASYTVSLLRPKVIADMRLHDYGYRVIERTISNFFPFENDYVKLGGGPGRTEAEFARFSKKDAAAYPHYDAALEKVANVLRDLSLKIPPNVGGGLSALSAAAKQGWPMAKLDLSVQRDLLDIFTKSARQFLDGWYEHDYVQSAFAFDAVVGNYAGVSTPGSAYVLLHHVFGEVNGKLGAWGHSVGGMGAITQAMARACEDVGVEISLEAPVSQVLVDGNKVTGVKLESGEEIAASVVASNAGPALLYRQLVDQGDLDEDFKRRIKGFKTCSGTFRMNVALSELPDFSVLPGKERAEHHTAGIIIAPGMDYMDQAFIDAQQHGWSRKPIVEIKLPSTVDDSLAPPGQHVASLFCQQFDPAVDWDTHRDAVADLIIDTVNDHAPNFKQAVIARQIHSPLDLERKFGLIGGDIMHGTMGIDQLWAARPVLGHGDYRGPIKGLYMCGAGTHPGGGVTGAPGHNAAAAILADRPLIRKILRS